MKNGTKSNQYKHPLTLFVVIILSFILVFPLSAGCGGAASNAFLELMSLVPADYAASSGDYPLYFTLVDHAAMYQEYGVTPADLEEQLSKIDQGDTSNITIAIGYGSYITGQGHFLPESTIRKEYVGYDMTCIDAEIQFGFQPVNPAEGVAAIGKFDPQATAEALSHQDGWPAWAVAAYTTEEYRGVTIYSWGDGLQLHIQDRFLPPHIDGLGRAKPLAVTDKYLLYAASVDAVKQLIDASNDERSSLADLPEYAAIANGLTDLNTYEAVIGPSSLFKFDSEYNEGEVSGPLLKKYLTCGTGLGKDENGRYVAVVLYHENTADAQANISLLRERTEYVIPLVWQLPPEIPLENIITDMHINAEGNLLLAKIYTSSLRLWASWFYYYPDSWLAHEG